MATVGKSRNSIVQQAFALHAAAERAERKAAKKAEPAPAPSKNPTSPRAKGGKAKEKR